MISDRGVAVETPEEFAVDAEFYLVAGQIEILNYVVYLFTSAENPEVHVGFGHTS